MKVEVLTNKDVTFKKWRWWSNWVDVAVFEDKHETYLLQMRVSRSNKKAFNAVSLSKSTFLGWMNGVLVSPAEVGDLTQMRKETP